MKAVVLAVVAAAAAAMAAEIAPEDRRSGYEFAAPETRAMQDDDTANPGILGVLQGETLWTRKVGAADRSCAGCHGDAGCASTVAGRRACAGAEPECYRSFAHSCSG